MRDPMGQYDRLYAQLNVIKKETRNLIRYTADDAGVKTAIMLEREKNVLVLIDNLIEVIFE